MTLLLAECTAFSPERISFSLLNLKITDRLRHMTLYNIEMLPYSGQGKIKLVEGCNCDNKCERIEDCQFGGHLSRVHCKLYM